MPRNCLLGLMLLIACAPRGEQVSSVLPPTTSSPDSIHVEVVSFSSLPDSLQPDTIILSEMPATKRSSLPAVHPDKGSGRKIVNTGKAHFKTLTTDDGLAVDNVWSSLVDQFGNVWFGTVGGGLSRYNGKEFKTFNQQDGLGNNVVNCMTQDLDGTLWFGTSLGGVSHYNGSTTNSNCSQSEGSSGYGWASGQFVNYGKEQGLCGNDVLAILADTKGTVWVGTKRDGISSIDASRNSNQCFQLTCSHDANDDDDLRIHSEEIARTVRSYSVADGLAGNTVASIFEDSDGFLWFCAMGRGVSRFDGENFVTFNSETGLGSNVIWEMMEDQQGNLWFGTETNGVSRFDQKGRKDACYLGSCDHDQTQIEAHYSAISKYFTHFGVDQGLSNNIVVSVTEDRSGSVWLGTKGGGVNRFDGQKVGSSCVDGSCGHNLSDSQSMQEHNSTLRDLITVFSVDRGLANNYVRSITEDRSGNLWMCTGGGGVSRYNGNAFVNYSKDHGLANNNVRCISQDLTGKLWFGTYGGGVTTSDGYKMKTFLESGGTNNNSIWTMLCDSNGEIWCGSDGGGVYHMSNDPNSSTVTIENIDYRQGIPNGYVRGTMQDSNGDHWFGTLGGAISKYDGDTLINYPLTPDLPNSTVHCMVQDRFGATWIANSIGGLIRFNDDSFVTFTEEDGLVFNEISMLTFDSRGNLWIGTRNGLSLLPSHRNYQLASLLRSRSAQDLAMSDLFYNMTDRDGLPDNFISQIVEADTGQLFLGTNAGLCELKFEGEIPIVVRHYDWSTGYPVKDVNSGQRAMFKDSDGVIWFATGSDRTALVRFDPSELRIDHEPPQVNIESLLINDQAVDWNSLIEHHYCDDADPILEYEGISISGVQKFYNLPDDLILPYQFNNVSFEFVATETGRNFMVKYQYMLEGYNEEWSDVTSRTTASFGNIEHGDYTFKLKARSPEGVWSDPVSFSFTVLPPWYRTIWAYAIAVFLFAFALREFVKWRERALIAEKLNLESIVKERTAEVVAEKKEVEEERERSDRLLLNILPAEVAEELKNKGTARAKHFEEVTVMFTDFKNFTQISEQLTPQQLVAEIHLYFKTFDHIIGKHGLEKIKTIGDSYMCAGGLPKPNATHALDTVRAAIEIQRFIARQLELNRSKGKPGFEIRIGIHTGPLVAGIVGTQKFQYDIWGDTVNVAARMESTGEPGMINLSETTFQLIKDQYNCIHRGKIKAKNKGEIDMYFLEGPK